MSSSFLVANFLSSVANCRNSFSGRDIVVESNKICNSIASVLHSVGYISHYSIIDVGNGRKRVLVKPKFSRSGENVIRSVKICSKPGRRVYSSLNQIKMMFLRNSFATVILSTSRGVITASNAINLGVGGEVICMVF